MNDKATHYFELKHVHIPPADPNKPVFATASIMSCRLCDRIIAGMGGPGSGAICVPCGEALMRGQLRNAVEWNEELDPSRPPHPDLVD